MHKKVTATALRIKAKEVLADVQAGDTYEVTKRDKVVALIVPVTDSTIVVVEDTEKE